MNRLWNGSFEVGPSEPHCANAAENPGSATMGQTLSGGCACGAIRYETESDPVIMLNCHCRDCQKASGSAYAAIVVFPSDAVRMTGEPRYHKVVGNAGKAVERGFCPTAAAKWPPSWNDCRMCLGCRQARWMTPRDTSPPWTSSRIAPNRGTTCTPAPRRSRRDLRLRVPRGRVKTR